MTAKDMLLTKEEAQAVGAKWNQWDEVLAQAQDAKTLKKILNRLEKANCEAVPEKRLAALEQALEELLAELDAHKGKEG